MSIFLTGQTDKQELQALVNCRNPDSKALLKLFQKLIDDTMLALVKADELVRVHRLQGRAEVLKDFLEAVEKAPSVLERTK